MSLQSCHVRGVGVGEGVEHAVDAGSIPRWGKGYFSPRLDFQCRLSYGVRTPLCAIAFIYIRVHVKDPVVHVGVQRIMETLKHPACAVGWVVQLFHSCLSLGKTT